MVAPTLGAFYEKKWVTLQSRGARDLNDSFLGWLRRRRPDRPFFAYLNYFDAHDPFVPPPGFDRQFGIPPKTGHDYQFLCDYVGLVKASQRTRDLKMAADCYDDCISFLDEQLGRLVGELRAQGLLENTTVIITSDHGEAFGDHGVFGHSYTVNLDEIGVPLVVLSPGAPAGKEVNASVSLRDLPATVADLLGLAAGSPFPGAVAGGPLGPGGLERPRPREDHAGLFRTGRFDVLDAHPAHGLGFGGVPVLPDGGRAALHRDGLGAERLFDLTDDPYEMENLLQRPGAEQTMQPYRKMLLDFLTENPASVEVESGYLGRYREKLRAAVGATSPKIASDLGRSP